MTFESYVPGRVLYWFPVAVQGAIACAVSYRYQILIIEMMSMLI